MIIKIIHHDYYDYHGHVHDGYHHHIIIFNEEEVIIWVVMMITISILIISSSSSWWRCLLSDICDSADFFKKRFSLINNVL